MVPRNTSVAGIRDYPTGTIEGQLLYELTALYRPQYCSGHPALLNRRYRGTITP